MISWRIGNSSYLLDNMGRMNSVINSCIKCGHALKWIPVLFIVAVLAWSYYAYIIQLCFCKYSSSTLLITCVFTFVYVSIAVFVQNTVQQGICWLKTTVPGSGLDFFVFVSFSFLFRDIPYYPGHACLVVLADCIYPGRHGSQTGIDRFS